VQKLTTGGVQCPNGIVSASNGPSVAYKNTSPREFDPNDLSDPVRRNELFNLKSVKKGYDKHMKSNIL
jgi:hypothetical protein